MKNIYLSLLFVLMGMGVMAQGSISGKIVEADTNEPIIGAVVQVEGTSSGAVSDLDGGFTIEGVDAGSYTLRVSSVGYQDFDSSATVADGQTTDLGNLTLALGSVALQGIEIIADVAIDRQTPVAVSNVTGEYISERAGNQELVEVLTVTPSVYATKQGGGAGDARINVRGFDQLNTAYLINGIPVNDMENGRVFWSNWAGLSDVLAKAQVQRGLGASMLAIPSVGGTVNLITKTTDAKKGGSAFMSLGNDLYRKYGVTLSTGNINNWAVTFSGTRTTGNGYVDATWNDQYSYFLSVSKDFKKHSFSLTGVGAPQRHGQRSSQLNLTDLVPFEGDDYENFIQTNKASDFDESGKTGNIRYNPQWGLLSGEMFNERVNFYHKPQFSLNHFWDASEKFQLSSALYYSLGRGGGTGPRGGIFTSRPEFRTGGAEDQINYDLIEETNSSLGTTWKRDGYIRRASMNEHRWLGLVSKAQTSLSETLNLTGGIDLRKYTGLHYRKVVNTLGAANYFSVADRNQQGTQLFGDDGKIVQPTGSFFGSVEQNQKINYDNDGEVDWYGGFVELEHVGDNLTAVVSGSLSNKGYQRIDRFNYDTSLPNNIDPNSPNFNPIETDRFNFWGYAVKGGLRYNIDATHSVFGNAGYLSTPPVFDIVFPRFNNVDINDDAANENVLGLELGYQYRSSGLSANLNLYRTNWVDKSFVERFNNPDGSFGYANLSGVDALHQGIEIDAVAKAAKWLDLTGSFSVGDWQWENNVSTDIFDEDNNLVRTADLFIKDLKVGNAPQTQFALGADAQATKNLKFDATYRGFADFYSDFDPTDRDDSAFEGIQAVQLPNYGLFDLGASYRVPVSSGMDIDFRANINNVFNELYVADARDVVGGTLADLRGWFGFGRTWNTAMKIRFKDGDKAPKEVEVPAIEPVLDRDGDGVLDDADKCPDTPGTVEGCPDADGDGVVDANDECVDTPGLASNNGCPAEPEVEIETVVEQAPIPDADGDGLLDNVDNCPNEAGPASNAGCPVVAAPVPAAPSASVVDEINFIAKSILFNTNSNVIRDVSKVKLDEIASIMMRYPGTSFVVEGHTDSVGDAGYNQSLSAKRAQAVVNYLKTKSVTNNLSSVGYGETRPIADNGTSSGRAQNRRVVVRLGN